MNAGMPNSSRMMTNFFEKPYKEFRAGIFLSVADGHRSVMRHFCDPRKCEKFCALAIIESTERSQQFRCAGHDMRG